MKKKYFKNNVRVLGGKDTGDMKKKLDRFLDEVAKLGFAPISKEREARDLEMQGIISPDSPRIEDLKGQTILDRGIDDMTIRAPLTWREDLQAFTYRGKLWVLMVQFNKEAGREPGVVIWKTPRTGDFLKRASGMIDLFNHILENRPADGMNRLMELVSRVGTDLENPLIWKGKDANGQEMTRGVINPKTISIEAKKAYDVWRKRSLYYEKVVRGREGYKLRERHIRKGHKSKNAQKK